MNLSKRIFVLLGITLVIVSLALWNLFSTSKSYTVNPISNRTNALWLRHQWVGEKHSEEEYKKLALFLKEKKMTDAFFHVGPLNEEGKIEKEKYLYAQDLTNVLKSYYPELHIQAWIGQVEKRGGGILDISNEEVRNNIVSTSDEFLSLGFDGIHYNIEPIYSNDKNIIDLLKKTREITKPQNKILSIASDELEVFPGAEKVIRLFSKQTGFWNKGYYKEVSENVDQIAVMMYDTALPVKESYSLLVAWETNQIMNVVSDKVVVFMGVPSYEDERSTFNPKVENVESSLLGIRKGLVGASQEKLNRFGVGIYAEWTTDEKEWETYDRLWLK